MGTDDLQAIIDRIANKQHTEEDITLLQQLITGNPQIALQIGKNIVNIGEGKEIHIGDRIYKGTDAEAIQQIIRTIVQELQKSTPTELNEYSQLKNSFKKLLSRSEPSSIRSFLQNHEEIIKRVFDCDRDSLIFWSCSLNNQIFDICMSKYYPTTHRHSWHIVQLGIVDGDILNSIDQYIKNITLLRNWTSQNLSIARELLPDFNSDFFGHIILGRRTNLSPEIVKKIKWVNDNLPGINIRTYDRILDVITDL